jgi:hypothetical protein
MYTLTALPVMFFFVVLLCCLPSASTTSTRPPRSCHLAVAGIRLALPIQSSSLPAMALWRLLTRPVWWHCPGTQCLGPKCPCAGSLALKALIEAEVSYTLTSFASSRGHESPGSSYPDRQRPLCLAGLLAVVVCLRPNRGPTVVFLGKSTTTTKVFAQRARGSRTFFSFYVIIIKRPGGP